MEPLRIFTFGGLRLLQGEVPISLVETRKAEALLVFLAHNQRLYRREVLADLLWDERSQQQALSNLRVVLNSLRKHLDPYLSITRETVALNWDTPIWSDVGEFEKRLSASLSAKQENLFAQDASQIEKAVELYQGDFLEGFYVRESRGFDDWAARERERLHRRAVEALHALIGYQIQAGEYSPGIDYATRLLQLDPLDELAHRQMMQLLALSGRRSEALAQYETCRRLLKDELGIEPAAATQALYEKIRSADLARTHPPLKAIRGYRLEEQIGIGSFGAVYCAVQEVVGREVAVKVILPQYTNDPEFIRRFETEAQVVARLEHPNIVPLYDYWREPDGAYLVMRLLKGGSLEKLLESGPPQASQIVGLVDQIAAGLATAHAQGVIHRDLKAANILLDEAGNAYLTDFGIAKVLGMSAQQTLTGQIIGTPVCLSPEQIRGEAVTARSDIYSFGILLYQILTGKIPFPDQSLAAIIEKHLYQPLPSVRDSQPNLPAEVDEVIQRATAKDPLARFPDVLALAAAFRGALAGLHLPEISAVSPVIEMAVELANPYKGLSAFQEADAGDFFGREALTERLVARLSETGEATRFLAVVGPSGSGKSSLVRAGLIPALRQGALPGSEKWFIVEMIPGGHPFEELEIGLLRIAAQPLVGLMEQLQRDERGILRAARLALPEAESELLLVIDQFEEVFTLVEDKDEARKFLKSLYATVTDPRSPVRVVITLRADFFDRPLMEPDFSKLVQERTEVVVPLSVEELGRAIRSPAERVGVTLEPGLATAIVTEVVEQPGALPLLQYALTELFEQRQDHRLTLEGYQAIGGVQGVLERRAEETFNGLGAAEQDAARQVFLRLVTLGEGVEDTRRRVLRSELEAVAGGLRYETQPPSGEPASPSGASSIAISQVIEAFGKARLLSFDRDPLTRSPTVEVAHEALLREWQRLRGWLDESRADVRTQRALGSAAAEWAKAGRDPSFLLYGSRLSQFESWHEQSDLALTVEEQALLEASLAQREAQRAAEAARQRREAALEQRSRNFLRTLVVVLLLATAASLVLAGLARRAQTLATSRELAVMGINSLETDPERSILLSLQALRTAHTREAEGALHQAIQASRVRMTLPGFEGGAQTLTQSPDGKTIAISNLTGKVFFQDAKSGKALFDVPGWAASFSPDGSTLATGSWEGPIILWDFATQKKLHTLNRHSGRIWKLQFSPDGALLLTASVDDIFFNIWDVETGQVNFSSQDLVVGNEKLNDVVFSPDGSLLFAAYSANDRSADPLGTVRVWRAGGDWALLNEYPSDFMWFTFSPKGNWLVTTGKGGDGIFLQDISTLTGEKLASQRFQAVEPETVPKAHDGQIAEFAFSPDESLLATGSLDSTVKTWRISMEGVEPKVEPMMTLSGHTGPAGAVSFSPDGTRLATASADGTARIWDITRAGNSEWFTLAAHTDIVADLDITRDGKTMATASYDGTAKVWDLDSGTELVAIPDHGSPLRNIAISPDGSLLATAGDDNQAKIWKLDFSPGAASAEWLRTIDKHAGGKAVGSRWPGLVSAVFSPDGTLLATGGADPYVRVWEVQTGQQKLAVPANPDGHGVNSLAFSPDGKYLATTGSSIQPPDGPETPLAQIWDLASGEKISTFSGHFQAQRILDLDFSPNGKHVATGVSRGLGVKIWDLHTGQELLYLEGHTATVLGVDFSPDGKYLATASTDSTVKVWDASTGEELLSITVPSGAFGEISFTPDGKKLIVARDSDVNGFIFELEDLIRLAETRVTRWFTLDECFQYLHQETCPPPLSSSN